MKNEQINSKKQLLFSLSKSNKDFIVEPISCSGHGGQNINKNKTGCRITHPESNTISECQDERSFEQNKKKAFLRLIKKDKFIKWFKMKKAIELGHLADIEEQVEKDMNPKNLKVEIQIDGKWVNIKDIEMR